MANKKAISGANLELALLENNKKLIEHTDASDKLLNDKIDDIKTQTVVDTYDEETNALILEFGTPAQGLIEDTLESDNEKNALSAKQGKVLNEKITNVEDVANEANSIAKGKNKARVFTTTEDMNTWLSNESNKGLAKVGDNLYIIDVGVPDWWISEVLEEPNSEGKFYNIAQLETQKVDLTTINTAISNLESDVKNAKIYTLSLPEGKLVEGHDLNGCINPGTWIVESSINVLNGPEGLTSGFKLVVEHTTNTNYVKQKVTLPYSNIVYERYRYWNSSSNAWAWASWYTSTTSADLRWKTLTLNDSGRTATELPKTATEFSVTISTKDSSNNYYFYNLHLTEVQNVYHPYRFYDGMSKATVVVNFGKIHIASAYVNNTDTTSSASLVVRYR